MKEESKNKFKNKLDDYLASIIKNNSDYGMYTYLRNDNYIECNNHNNVLTDLQFEPNSSKEQKDFFVALIINIINTIEDIPAYGNIRYAIKYDRILNMKKIKQLIEQQIEQQIEQKIHNIYGPVINDLTQQIKTLKYETYTITDSMLNKPDEIMNIYIDIIANNPINKILNMINDKITDHLKTFDCDHTNINNIDDEITQLTHKIADIESKIMTSNVDDIPILERTVMRMNDKINDLKIIKSKYNKSLENIEIKAKLIAVQKKILKHIYVKTNL